MASRADVYKALDSERDYQDKRWVSEDHVHTLSEWTVYIQDYLAEMTHILTRMDSPGAEEQALHSIRKITAMGVCCMEQNGAPQREGFER